MGRWVSCTVLAAALSLVLFAAGAHADDWTDRISVFGELDFRAQQHWTNYDSHTPQTPDDVQEFDYFIRRAVLGADVEVNDYVSGRVSAIWEEVRFETEDRALFDEAEAYVRVQIPLLVTPYVEFGRMYLPVGRNDTFGALDTLVFFMTETWQTAAGLGLLYDYFDLSVHVFNGRFDWVDGDGEPEDDILRDLVIHLELFPPLLVQERVRINFGVYWLTDATETELDFGNRYLTGNYLHDKSMIGAYLTYVANITEWIGIGLIAEYVNTERFRKSNYQDNSGDAAQLRAFNGELAFLIYKETLKVGAKYEFIEGFDFLETQQNNPDEYEVTRFRAASGFVSVEGFDHFRLVVQYRHGWDNEHNIDQILAAKASLEF